jgi:hypothetical protein
MRMCPSCGFPISRGNLPTVCPKCDEDLVRAKSRKPLVVDLAHGGETVSMALAKLDAAVSECVWHGHPSLKVIHGHCAVVEFHASSRRCWRHCASTRSGWAR